MDSGVLARVLDDVLAYGGDYRIDRLDVGRAHDDESYARLVVSAADDESLNRLLMRLQAHGVNQVDPGEALLREVQQDGVFPDDFYSTTNLETLVRLGSTWVPVEQPEMDCGLLVHGEARIRTVPVSDVKAGDRVVCGAGGVKVELPLRSTAHRGQLRVHGVGGVQREAAVAAAAPDRPADARGQGRRRQGAVGRRPGVVHTGARPAMVALVEAGYVDVLFAGNALATHDIEASLYGTSLGVDLAQGKGVEHGHEHHIRAINQIRKAGPSRLPSSRAC
jgi:lysine-ketoglutarate reductase/saccharopine dehydrogenase-like protein (TIGR00300 family)